MKTRPVLYDHSATALSALCILHCLLLPALAVSLPVAGVLSEMEWLHRLFVLMALPLSAIAFSSPLRHRGRNVIRFCAAAGATLLVLGAFVEALHDHETLLTVAGALLLGTAHLVRAALRSHRHESASALSD
ncbi:MAG: MerC domain-containing protein [Litorimonas sp.]